MSHDFAKASKKKPRPTATRKPLPKAKTKPGNRAPLGLWLVALILSALLIAGLISLAKFAPRSASNSADTQPESETQFDFFTLLPESEIEINAPVSNADDISFEYFLQAGSFKRAEDAETRRGELALMGFESHVTEVLYNSNRWHRVQIGPIPSRSQLAAIRGALLENGYETLVIKQEIQ